MVTLNYNTIGLFNEGYGLVKLRTIDIETMKDMKKLVRDAERIVRTSIEYKRWVGFVHGILGQNFVCYYSGETALDCKIELHHHPYTLYDIVNVIIDNNISNGIQFNTYTIAEQVMALHYINAIGFVPLAKTYHEKYHNKVLKIPVDVIEGNWRKFEDLFLIPEQLQNKVSIVTSYNNKSDWYIKDAIFNKLVTIKGVDI